MDYKQAKKLLEEGKPSLCIDYFKENGYLLEYGYSLLLLGDLDGADNIFSKLNSVRSDWARKLIPMMQGHIYDYPTYFQIRNFLEIDITMLLKAGLKDYVQYVIGAADSLYDINSETYKFVARALLKNGYAKNAKAYLDKCSDYCYKDRELHFLIAEYYMFYNDIENACSAARKCLKLSADYYPAIQLLEKYDKDYRHAEV